MSATETIGYNVKFSNNSTWEILSYGDHVVAFNRSAFKSFRDNIKEQHNETSEYVGDDHVFCYEDWKAFQGTELLRTEQATEDALPIIYYVTNILGYPKMERIRTTKFKFSK